MTELQKMAQSLSKFCQPEVFAKEDETNLLLSEELLAAKLMQEKDGVSLYNLWKKGESRVCERFCLHQLVKGPSGEYYEIPSWNHFVAHLRIVDSV